MDRAWLDRRSPPPPDDLAKSVREAVAQSPGETLFDAASRSLRSARSAPGRVRESAFALLTADALITYACEEALEADDPQAELATLLAIAGS